MSFGAEDTVAHGVVSITSDKMLDARSWLTRAAMEDLGLPVKTEGLGA